VQLIEIELSKAYLYRALRCKDSDSDSIYCLANVYLAVLYFTTGQYQTTIDHCTLVTRSQDHSQCSSHVVQGEILPKIDENIDTVLGLSVFYQYIRTAALNQQQTQHVSVFTTELFARYLHIRCLSSTQIVLADEAEIDTRSILNSTLPFIADVLLTKSIKRSFKQKVVSNLSAVNATGRHAEKVTTNSCEMDTSELVELLQQYAVEHMTSYRHFQQYRSVDDGTMVTTDYEALYAYKRADYQRCFNLSAQYVHTLLNVDRMATDLATFPQFLQLMDDDIVSLIALTLIIEPEFIYSTSCRITQLTLSLYLMTQCQLKLRHPVLCLAHTLHCIKFAHRRHVNRMFDQLVLKLAARKISMTLRCG